MIEMHILLINPNSTQSMTDEIAQSAKSSASVGTRITAVNPDDGPKSIQGREDGEACLPHLYRLFDEMVTPSSQYNAVIIACFDDTGLYALKARSKIPVIGIGEAAFHAASILGPRFSTVTTLAGSAPVIEDNIRRYGFVGQSINVRASGIPVLDVGEQTANIIQAEAGRAASEDECDVIVLGCAGMAGLAAKISLDVGLPVIDGVSTAVAFCEALAKGHAA